MKPGQVVAYVDANGLVHDAAIVSVISDGKGATSALTLRTLDDGVERSNVQHAEDRPSSTDIRVLHGHISAGHWRQATSSEASSFSAHATRRSETVLALSRVDETPGKDETPAETAKRVASEKTAITLAAPEPALLVDETPWVDEAPSQTEQRIADARARAARP